MRLGIAAIIAIAIPALEIVGIYQIGSRIGLVWTLIWLVSAMFAGVAVIRLEQASFLPRLQLAMVQRQSPFGLLWASGRRFLAGVLLILPGAGSDVMAMLLLLWPNPRLPAGEAARPRSDSQPGRTSSQSRAKDDADGVEGEVIEGDFRRED